jgi:hypothetical protein
LLKKSSHDSASSPARHALASSPWNTSIGVLISPTAVWGEWFSYMDGSTYGSPISCSQLTPSSVVPWTPRSSHSEAWVMIALNRSVWPATQLAI